MTSAAIAAMTILLASITSAASTVNAVGSAASFHYPLVGTLRPMLRPRDRGGFVLARAYSQRGRFPPPPDLRPTPSTSNTYLEQVIGKPLPSDGDSTGASNSMSDEEASSDSLSFTSSTNGLIDEEDYCMSVPMPIQTSMKSKNDSTALLPTAVEAELVKMNGDPDVTLSLEVNLMASNVTVNGDEGAAIIATLQSNKVEPRNMKSLLTSIRKLSEASNNQTTAAIPVDEEASERWKEWMTSGRKTHDSGVGGKSGSTAGAGSRKGKKTTEGNESTLDVMKKKGRKDPDKNDDAFQESDFSLTSPPSSSPAKIVGAGRRKKTARASPSAASSKASPSSVQRNMLSLARQRSREAGRVSANDWMHNLLNLYKSTILRDVRSPVAFVFGWSVLLSLIHRRLSILEGGIMKGAVAWKDVARHLCLPTAPHSMMVSALGLLLVFRTNAAYQRFAEGRKIWEDIVDISRDLSRMTKLFESVIGTKKRRRILKLLASFPYLLRHRIRPSLMMRRISDSDVERDPKNSLLLYPDEAMRDSDPDVAAIAYEEEEIFGSRRKTRELCWVDKRTLPWRLLPRKALEGCARAHNRPLWVCDRLAKELVVVPDSVPGVGIPFTNRERLHLIGFVDKLSRSIGACERIHQTVVPTNYARHALRSLTVWLWALPFALVKDLGLLTGPVVAVVSWILFGVYEIGTRIEDPFQGTLRLSIYCDAIRRDVVGDAIARDTAFELDDYSTPPEDVGDEDAIFEVDSESEEYEGDVVPAKMKKTGRKKTGIWGS